MGLEETRIRETSRKGIIKVNSPSSDVVFLRESKWFLKSLFKEIFDKLKSTSRQERPALKG